jgi:hypothetical protein
MGDVEFQEAESVIRERGNITVWLTRHARLLMNSHLGSLLVRSKTPGTRPQFSQSFWNSDHVTQRFLVANP